jgi:autotransporter-associated beta strand protein
MKKQEFLLVLLAGVAGLPAWAQDSAWTGNAVGGEWTDILNWDVAPAPAVYSNIVFDVFVPTTTAGETSVDDAFNINTLRFETNSALLMAGFTINATGPGALNVGGSISTVAAGVHRFAVPVTFTNDVSPFVNILNEASSPGLAFDGTAEVLADTTLGINNVASTLTFAVDFTSGLSGAGNLQVGTLPFVTDTLVTLFGNNTLSGDLRMRNNVNVVQDETGTLVGSLSEISRIFIESPVNFSADRAVLSFGGTTGSPYIDSDPNYINDTAEINLANGHLNLQWLAPDYVSPSIEENVGDVQFRFGHSFLSLTALSQTNSFSLNASSVSAIEPGATGVLSVLITDAIPVDPDPVFVGAGSIFSQSPVTLIGGAGGITDNSSTQVAIVPWLVAGLSTGEARSFLTYDDTLGFRPLADSQYLNAVTGATLLDNVSIENETLAGNGSLNALRMEGDFSTELDLGGFDLEVASGSVLFAGSSTRSITNGNMLLGAHGHFFVEAGTDISASIGGNGSLTISGGGLLQLSGCNTYQGITYLNQVVELRNDAALGSSGSGTWINQDVHLLFAAGANSIDEEFFVKGSAVAFTVQETSTELLQNINVDPYVPGESMTVYFNTIYGGDSGASLFIRGNILTDVPTDYVFSAYGEGDHGSGSLIDVSGVIEDTDASDSDQTRVFKYGRGRLVLRSDNLYTGDTAVFEGALLVTGQSANGSATGSGSVLINSGEYSGDSLTPYLGGDGRVGGDVFVNGASIKPSVETGFDLFGTLTIGGDLVFFDRTFGSDVQLSYLVLDLSGSSFGFPGNDAIVLDSASTPNLDLDQKVVLELTLLDDVVFGDFFDIVVASSGSLDINGFFLADDPGNTVLTDGSLFTVNTVHGDRTFQIHYLSDRVRLSAIPEPSAAVLAALGALSLLSRRVRERNGIGC